MPPTFYFAIGARARRRDLEIAMLVGQCHYLVPAGSPTARLLAQTPGVHVVLDSWAFPPGNTDRPSLPRYAHLVANWYTRNLTIATQQEAPWFDWALSYDTIGDALASERDEYRLSELLQSLCHCPDPPLVPVTHYPGPDAEAIVGDLLRDHNTFAKTEWERAWLLWYRWGAQTQPTETTKAMDSILSLVRCLHPTVTMTTIRHLSRIALAMLAMTGRVTMLGLARWAGSGGSYRTLQRFFHATLPWAAILWTFVHTHLLTPGERYLLVGDECVVTKTGRQTYGVERFFSSIFGKPVPGVSLFALALVSCRERQAFPVQIMQIVREPAVAPPPPASAAKRKPGRPKGSSTRAKADAPLNAEHTRISLMIQDLLERIRPHLALTYLVLDGHFGNHNAVLMARRLGLQLISKLRSDSALYYPYDGPYAGRGPRRLYGERLVPTAIPERFLKQTSVQDQVETRIYQVETRHQAFDQVLNLVVIVKCHQTSGKQAHVYLFSSDRTLAWDELQDDYRLRFQIEFTFRDAKQYWGLEDFMVIKEAAVTNALNLAFFMVNLSRRLARARQGRDPQTSVLDLKTHYRGLSYAEEVIKLLPEKPEPGLLRRLLAQVTGLGRIHPLPADSLTR